MVTTISRRTALALFGAAAQANAARATTFVPGAAVEAAFRPLLARYDVPGIAIGVTIAGRRWFYGTGLASRETEAPVAEDTLFEIGSISKIFAATLAAHAQAKGVLSLDARVERLVPELRGRPIGRASLLHLCTYTAGGLPLQFPDGIDDDDAALAWFRQWEPLAAPGTQRRYSNPSIVLLSLAVGRAIGRRPAEAIEDLLAALGLHRSAVRVADSERARYAQGYDKDGRPIRLAPNLFPAAAYGVKATASDMLAFLEATMRPDRWEPTLRRAVADTQRGRFRIGPMVQGLGWEIYPRPAPLDRLLAGNSTEMAMTPQAAERIGSAPSQRPGFLNKTGSTNGFGAYVALIPEKATGLVMLANKNLPIAARVTAAHAVLEAAARE